MSTPLPPCRLCGDEGSGSALPWGVCHVCASEIHESAYFEWETKRRICEAVLPLVLALERLAEDQDSTTFARRNAARRLCEEARKKWGEL
jgi:hypothetical protein